MKYVRQENTNASVFADALMLSCLTSYIVRNNKPKNDKPMTNDYQKF